MQMFLTGVLLGFIVSLLLCDDLAERKLNNYLKEKENTND